MDLVPVQKRRNRTTQGLKRPVLKPEFYSLEFSKKASIAALSVVGWPDWCNLPVSPHIA